MILYATPSDLATWTGSDAPTDVVGLLRSASLAVREATETAYYPADPTTGLPTDLKTLEAFRDATCAQAAALYTLGIDASAGGTVQEGVHASDGIGSARITYADADAAAGAKQRLISGLCVDATRILRQANIVLGVPWIVG